MAVHRQTLTRAPGFVRFLNPVMRRLLGRGIPMGPDGLITVRGRRTGEPRTVPIAFLEQDGRCWVIAAYGDVNWVRNLRAAGEATIEIRGRSRQVSATELTQEEGAAFFRDIAIPYLEHQPRMLRSFLRWLLRELLADPVAAARTRPVFELRDRPA